MSVGWSGFSAVGDPKVVPAALADHIERNHLQGKLQFDLYVGVSSGVKSEDRCYIKKFVLRQLSISNSPEVIRKLGVIAMNTPVEVDIYGQSNSSHLYGTKMVNGNGYITILHCPSSRKTKNDKNGISSFVPMCSHVDHTKHDLDVIVTEQGLADLRGLSPLQRARAIIDNCCHPSYRDQLNEYLEMAKKECFAASAGHEPQILEKAFKMHTNLIKNGTMHLKSW